MTTTTSPHAVNPPTGEPTMRRLERGDGPIGGVAGGLADYFNVDPTIVRLGIVATTLISGPVIPACYIASWMIIPRSESVPPPPAPPATPPMPATAAPAPSAATTTATSTATATATEEPIDTEDAPDQETGTVS